MNTGTIDGYWGKTHRVPIIPNCDRSENLNLADTIKISSSKIKKDSSIFFLTYFHFSCLRKSSMPSFIVQMAEEWCYIQNQWWTSGTICSMLKQYRLLFRLSSPLGVWQPFKRLCVPPWYSETNQTFRL